MLSNVYVSTVPYEGLAFTDLEHLRRSIKITYSRCSDVEIIDVTPPSQDKVKVYQVRGTKQWTKAPEVKFRAFEDTITFNVVQLADGPTHL